MAFLTESETYEAEIYQLEVTDPVLGGPTGVSNRQPKQLANRTKWLKRNAELLAERVTAVNNDAQVGLTDIRNNGAFVPVGATLFVIGSAAPRGYLKMNGALLSRTTYAALWTFAQTALAPAGDTVNYPGLFGTGDGTTTFQLPDTRGWFPRFWSDGSSGGIDTTANRAVGSFQYDAVAGHEHAVTATKITYQNTTLDGSTGVEENAAGTAGWRLNDVTKTSFNNFNEENLVRNIALLGVIKF